MTATQTVKGFFGRHYAATAKAQCNTCSVGTWAINREQHLYATRNERGLFLKKLIKRIWATELKENVRPESVKTAMATTACTRSECKILILCKGCTFSEDVMEYAVDMASKTKSGIVALNLDEQGDNFSSFRMESEKNVATFACKAADAGLQFAHVVEQGAEVSVVARLYSEDEAFRYVMDDVVSQTSRKQIIPVYTRAMLRVK
ncbi:hypothetical protein DWB63_03015 [Pseudodesulfovibrio sp. S3]|nr:hypothetical protein DWB63_03015 [Pseudodesulfovibrio sp. S3]